MGYCEVEDLLIGDMPVGASTPRQKYIDDATDEIDSAIGVRYITPLNLTESDPETEWENPIPRHIRLHIKRIASHLASGRLILAISAGGEDYQLQAYGRSLVEQALGALKEIVSGMLDLEGAVENPSNVDSRPRGPVGQFADSESLVDRFYQFTGGQYPGALPNAITPGR